MCVISAGFRIIPLIPALEISLSLCINFMSGFKELNYIFNPNRRLTLLDS